MDETTIVCALREALRELCRIDLGTFRFGEDVAERTLMCRLAFHLARRLESENTALKVDCEYNRHGEDTKKRLSPKREGDQAGPRIFPDIIFHERREKNVNKLVCEIKKNAADGDNDRKRLLELTQAPFSYELGVFLVIEQAARQVKVEYFKGGLHPPPNLEDETITA